MKKDVDDLRREHEKDEALEASFEKNPIKRVIQSLFHDEFSGNGYKRYTLPQAKNLAEEKIKKVAITGVYIPAGKNLIKKIKKASTIDEMLLALNEYLFS